jgi:vacuolar-type H+-ATPase subunit I/STV1
MGIVSKIGNWLDSRFPEKVVVTVADFQKLISKNKVLEEQFKEICQTNIEKNKATEDNLNSLKAELEQIKSDLLVANEAVKNVRLMNGIQSNASKFINDYKR